MSLTFDDTQADAKPIEPRSGEPQSQAQSKTVAAFSLPRTASSRIGIIDDALRIEKYLYTHLLTLTERQTQAIASQDNDQLLRLLSERQSVVDRLVAQHKCFAPYRARWNELIEGIDDPTRSRIEHAIDELRTMAEHVANADDEAAKVLSTRKSAIQTELFDVGKSRAALSAYGTPKATITRFQDTQA